MLNPRPRKRNWSPYLLVLPSLVFLALFFAWPMVRGLALTVWDDEALLALHEQPDSAAPTAGRLPVGTRIVIRGQQGNVIDAEAPDVSSFLTEVWLRISGPDASGATVEGWAPESRIRVREQDEGGAPTAGTVRRKLTTTADPATDVYAEPNAGSKVVGKLEPNTQVGILESITLEVWYDIAGEVEGETVAGWAQSRYIEVYGDGVSGRVDRGNAGELTSTYIEKMVNDRFFRPALLTTLLLMVIIIPVQFLLAIVMALIIQSRVKGNTTFLYIFAIPLAVSDLAVGIVWYSIFTQYGYLNSILQLLGLITTAQPYLTAETRYWIIIAIWMAEVWRATSIVMLIVVSGLQAIPDEVLEAGEVFGASAWQRVRLITLPLLRPSLQVALILRTILAFQVFAVVIALGGGDVVTVLANEAYRQYYDFLNPNVAAAYGGLILLLSMISAVIYLRMVRTQMEQEIAT
jgi:multiple sugar transport system permease protein